MTTVADIIDEIEHIAPLWLAEENDRIGLQVGSEEAEVGTLRVCVDASPRVIGLAMERPAALIVAHHPLIYSPLASVTERGFVSREVMRLVRAGASLYVAHTNLDSAPGGVNDALADVLGLSDTRIMMPRKQEQFYKIVVFVPEESLEDVRDAMAEAGAGVIGGYSHCSFRSAGTGSFLPSGGAKPYIGSPGSLEEVSEFRLEMLCAGTVRENVIKAMTAAHPYEEVACDVYPLANTPADYGFGRVGEIAEPCRLSDFAELVRARLELSCLKTTGDLEKQVRRVAVMSGGGSSGFAEAARHNADVYVTGDTRHHDVLAADAMGLAVIDAGHFETERPGMVALADKLKQSFSRHEIDVAYVE